MTKFYLLCCLSLCFLGTTLAQITPIHVDFVVNDITLANPLAGGLNAPQLSAVDLDNNGVLDLYIFDRVGDVHLTFINEGTAGETQYRYAPEYAENFPELENWALLRDYNGDNIMDIFAHSTIPGIDGIEVYRGLMIDDKIAFEKLEFPGDDLPILYFPLQTGGRTNLFVSNVDYPAIDDIDCDGDLDILTFSIGGGYVQLYKNHSIEEGYGLDSLIFTLEDDCWGGFYESGIFEELDLSDNMGDCFDNFGGEVVDERHAGSTLLTFDADEDGDKEVVLGDISFTNAVLGINGGDCTTAWINEQDTQFPESEPVDIVLFPAHYHLDLDNDGARDFVAAPNNRRGILDTENVWFYKNTGSDAQPIFEMQQKDMLVGEMVDVGTGAHPTFVDYNADGLLDLVVGNNTLFKAGADKDPRLFLFKNIGTADTPVFELVDDNYLDFSQFGSITFNLAPEFGDLDSDGDKDLLIGDDFGKLFYLENMAGAGNTFDFAEPIYEWKDIDVGLAATPQLIDLNGDGLLDIVLGERGGNNDANGACGTINYFQNVGTANNPDFIADVHTEPNTGCLGRVLTIPPFSIVSYSVPKFIQVDGEWQLFVGTDQGDIIRYGDVEGNIYGEFTKLEEDFGNLHLGARLSQNFVDIDNDGKLEMIVGNDRGGLSLYQTDFDALLINTTNPKNELALEIFPNPAGEVLNIHLKDVGNAAIIRIYSAAGALLRVENMAVALKALDIKNFSTGVYIVEIERDGLVGRRKIVKK